MIRRGEFARARQAGFTLVEILIVITIIAILASITLSMVQGARTSAMENTARTTVRMLSDSLQNYLLDEGVYPAYGKKPDPERNDFPELYNALLDRPKSEGGLGGRNSPYVNNIEQDSIVVKDDTDPSGYRRALRAELNDNKIDKYILDPFGSPYVYRCNKGLPAKDWMRNPRGYDIYSFGVDNEDQTILADEELENDDIGNW